MKSPEKRRLGKEMIRMQQPVKPVSVECQNKFKVLQEEEGEMENAVSAEEPMEFAKDTKETDSNQGNMEKEGTEGNTKMSIEQLQMEIDPQKDSGRRVMKRLVQDWKNLDERFIPEEQKQLYKEMFQKYKEKKGTLPASHLDQTGVQGTQSTGMHSFGKGGRKRGRRTMSETIQMVGETLVNSRRVIPLSEVFQKPSKKL